VSLVLAAGIYIFPQEVHHSNTSNEVEHDHSQTTKSSMMDNNNNNTRSVVVANGVKGHLSSNESEAIRDLIKSERKKSDLKIEVTIYENENDENMGVRMTSPHNFENNILLSTLDQTGSLLSINKLGIKSSRYSLNKVDDDENNENSVKKSFLNGHKSVETDKEEMLSLFEKSIQLLQRPVFICVIIMAGIESLLQNSFLAFASLFLEYQYRLASGSASLVLGFLSIPPLMIGGLLSGLITKRMNDKPTSCLKFLACVLFFNLIVYAGFIVYCKEPTLISRRTTFVPDNLPFNVSDNCDCNAKIFKPVCLINSDDTFFQSACLAGCSVYDSTTERFFNCTQAPQTFFYNASQPLAASSSSHGDYFANGLCETDDCTFRLVISYASIGLLMFLNALTFLPYLKVTIGCINEKEMNSLGLGIKQFFMTAFGTIPGPIMFGAVIDSQCTYWHTDLSDQSVCKMYDNRGFALGMGLMGMGFKFICFLLVILSYFLIKNSKARR
jgi:hypothetical protein